MEQTRTTFSLRRHSTGSALILTVVLTSLLAIVGVLFMMASRIDQMASSAVSKNKDLQLAVETVVGELERQLVLDVPGVAGQEYYDYPGPNDIWLASLEPNDSMMWQQISDVTGYLKFRSWATNNVAIMSGGTSLFQAVIPRNKPIALDVDESLLEQLADADGDGIADAKWFEIGNMTTSSGKPIYAAVRVIDNGGLLNVNTGLGFNPTDPNLQLAEIDGSSQLQINIMALAGPRGLPPRLADINALLRSRANYGTGVDPNNLAAYSRNVIWSYGRPDGSYTPFDISDELELRFRFLLNHSDIDTRLEDWSSEFRNGTIMTPVEQGGIELDNWFKRASDDGSLDPNYAFRHIATTYSVDRVINAFGPSLNNGKMINVNTANKFLLHDAIMQALLDANPLMLDADDRAAQIAANIIDYRDPDSEVTYFDANSTSYNGFEQPCIYISEVACNVVTDQDGNYYRSYAIELFKPYAEDNPPQSGEWEIVIDGNPIPLNWSGGRLFHVLRIEDLQAPLPLTAGAGGVQDMTYTFSGRSNIYLQRKVRGVGLVVDAYIVPDGNSVSGWLRANAGARSIERDINQHKCIRKLWADAAQAGVPTLGGTNRYTDQDTRQIQAHPTGEPFTSIGEIGMVLAESGYNVPARSTDADLLLDLKNPMYSRLLNYLTVIDPYESTNYRHPIDETRIKGRININTAPWYVLEQLPWMSINPVIGRAVAALRDNLAWGFKGTCEMTQVPEMGFYADTTNPLTQGDQTGFPDLTYTQGTTARTDGAVDDMEERDLIFHRISNLITVRSDVFTAYILVRIGPDGPQRRVMVIIDRSNVTSPAGKPKIIALHPVEDPR